jgi:signal transduction histidine kinase
VALLEDITDARRQAAERELLARQRDEAAAQQASFEKQLIGIVSHDLRTPLGTILLGTSLLVAREDLDQGVTKTLTRIQNAAARATRMVDDLLDFTQARLAGKIAIERRDCNLQRLVDEVIAELEMSHAQRQLIVRHEGGGEGVWDPDRIKQVVQNLLVNALKYSPGDTPVCVTTQSQGEHIAIRVHNGGEPIAEEKLPVLFEPMQRAAGHVRDAARSVGLGLYIVRQLVEAHGGTVSVRSSADEGTEFMVRLPHRSGS